MMKKFVVALSVIFLLNPIAEARSSTSDEKCTFDHMGVQICEGDFIGYIPAYDLSAGDWSSTKNSIALLTMRGVTPSGLVKAQRHSSSGKTTIYTVSAISVVKVKNVPMKTTALMNGQLLVVYGVASNESLIVHNTTGTFIATQCELNLGKGCKKL